MEPGFIDDVVAAIHTVSNVPYPCPDIQPLIDVNNAADNFKNSGWKRKTTSTQTHQLTESDLPWDFQQLDNGFNVRSAEKTLIITITDVTGKQVTKFSLPAHEVLKWQNEHLPDQVLIVSISDKTRIHNYKIWAH